jgi:hypothetical protein
MDTPNHIHGIIHIIGVDADRTDGFQTRPYRETNRDETFNPVRAALEPSWENVTTPGSLETVNPLLIY